MADNDKAGTPQVKVHTYGGAKAISKADEEEALTAVRSTALEADDEFAQFFKDNALKQKVDIIQPPYNQNTLAGLCQLNNALAPAIEAMVNNVDGTGHSIRLRNEKDDDDDDDAEGSKDAEGNTKNDAKQKRIEDFFEEVFPSQSFTTLRKQLRRDLETVGNAYMEVMRNLAGDLVFLRYVRAKDIRLVKLDTPIEKEVVLTRNDQQVTVTMLASERRYAQIVGNKMVFFREMNATRHLHRTEGLWENSEAATTNNLIVEPKDRANELIHLTMIPDVRSPYGTPRWIAQMPSVLGSRKAEEHNLAFFDSGGIPPVLITIAGGQLGEEAQKTLEQFFSGQASTKQRGVVMEVENSGGTLDKEGTGTKIEVVKFGAEQVKDSMFEKYDERSEKRVRRSFRLPPLFVGQAEDFSFATAFASYTVAEAQVFQPERAEFDEMVNNLIMPELDPDGLFEFMSLPITVNDTAQRLDAIKIALEAGGIDAEGVIDAINDLVGLELKFDPDAVKVDISGTVVNAPDSKAPSTPASGNTAPGQQAAPAGPTPTSKTDNVIDYPGTKKKNAEDLVALATRAHSLMQKTSSEAGDAEALIELSSEIKELGEEDLPIFQQLLSVMQFNSVENDPTGLGRLAGCSLAVLAAQV